MATSSQTGVPLNEFEPPDFHREFQTWIEIQYTILPKNAPEDPDDYEFSYRRVTTIYSNENLYIARLHENEWIPFWRSGVAISPLDIHIKFGDMLVLVETVDSDASCTLHWSLTNDALTTREDRKALYGELRYKERGGWKKRAQYSEAYCRLVWFKANYSEDYANNSHKFNYNVSLRNSAGQMIEYEIDPDIKNPSS